MRWWPTKKRDADLDRELLSDLELEEEEQRENGRSPQESRYAARRAFGNTALIAEQTRETWGWLPLERLFHDLRYACRQLRRSAVFTATAMLILALGIGAVTAVFSLINAALLKMLPVESPDQLVQFKSLSPALPSNDAFSYPELKAFRDRTDVLAGVLAFRKQHNLDFEVDGQAGLVEGQVVSGNYFSVLGVKAILGRTLLPTDESVAGQNPVAVISYDYWRSRFALDPGVVGKNILLNNSAFTMVGVTEPEFYGLQPGEKIDVSVPLTTLALVNRGFAAPGSPYDTLKAPFRNWLYVIGRLQPGVSAERASASLQPLYTQSMRIAADSLAGLPFDSPETRHAFLQFRLRLDPAGQGLAALRQQFSKPLWIVMAVVGLLLLVSCANIANLLLARAQAREREISVRLAMGAGKSRLMRQLITESMLLGLGGGAVGVALAYLASSSLLSLMAHGRNPVSLSVHPDLFVLAFTLGVSLLTALVFGTVPAWRASHVNPSQGLAQNPRSLATPRRHSRLGKSLVIVQVAVSLVLLIGAGLLTRSLANLHNLYPGFNRDHVLLVSVNPPMVGYTDERLVSLYERALARIRAIPEVRSASFSVHQPLSTNVSDTSLKVQGFVPRPGEELAPVNVEAIGPEYFATMETPLLRGRDLTAADRDGARQVAIVNETTAHHYFGDASPIGRLVSLPGYRGDPSWIEIVGEVRDVKVHDLREQGATMLYLPMFQDLEGGATFEIRTATDPSLTQAAVLSAIKEIDRRLPIYGTKTLDDQLNDSLVQERLVASLSGMFGLLALLLACVGLYGLMAYTVNRRTGEIGIRMALGAERNRIARMVLRETLLLVASGLAIGIPAAVLASRLIASQLFGLKPGDPVTFAASCAVMAAVMTAASYLPARRAASVDPMQALRSE